MRRSIASTISPPPTIHSLPPRENWRLIFRQCRSVQRLFNMKVGSKVIRGRSFIMYVGSKVIRGRSFIMYVGSKVIYYEGRSKGHQRPAIYHVLYKVLLF